MSTLSLIIIGVSIISGQLLAVIWMLASSHKQTEKIESYLDKSEFIESNRKVFASSGLLGKVIRNGCIALLFLRPEFFEKRRLIEKDELLNLPVHLKRKLLAPWITAIFFLLALSLYPLVLP